MKTVTRRHSETRLVLDTVMVINMRRIVVADGMVLLLVIMIVVM